jgi:hypothetical protein
VTVRQRLDDGSWSYRVRCPNCRCWIVNGVRPRVVLQLLLAQAEFETWSLPSAECEHGTGPAISIADLAELRADLNKTNVVELLRAMLDAA